MSDLAPAHKNGDRGPTWSKITAGLLSLMVGVLTVLGIVLKSNWDTLNTRVEKGFDSVSQDLASIRAAQVSDKISAERLAARFEFLTAGATDLKTKIEEIERRRLERGK